MYPLRTLLAFSDISQSLDDQPRPHVDLTHEFEIRAPRYIRSHKRLKSAL